MISKHVDLIAVGILLLAVAAFNSARQVVVVTMHGPIQYWRMDDNRAVRGPEMPQIPVMPEIPRVPRIPLQRD